MLQRVGNSKVVEFSGGYGNVTPAQIEARVVDYTTGAQVTPWTALSNPSIGNGLWSGQLNTPQGGWYRIQVRDSARPAGVVSGATRWGVGIIVLMCGQSNMFNLSVSGTYGYPTGHPLVVEPASGAGVGPGSPPYTYRRVGLTNDNWPPNTMNKSQQAGLSNGKTMPGHVHLGNLLAMSFNVPVLLLNKAKSGSKIDAVWMTGQSGWNDVELAVAAVGSDFELVYWLQGESNSGMARAVMVGHLNTLYSQLKTLSGRNSDTLKMGIISLGPVSLSSSYSGASDTKFGEIRAAHVEFASNTPGAFFAAATHDSMASDGVHMGAMYQARTGAKAAMSYIALKGRGPSGAGPRVTGGARTGVDIDLDVQQAGGTALADGAGGNGTALRGFRVFDATDTTLASPLQIASTMILGPDKIRLRLAVAPAGSVLVDYGMTNTPHSPDPISAAITSLSESAVYDNVAVVNSPVGCLLQPFAAIHITGS
ncbi:sialate O-acetylesterase [Massilia sp. HP4]|uniref:sialate O-acetylesterase n=1 Tax=Massilia sp. HP4 TaxID=2562316 RepID=UPI001485B84F|nr:sialate O-acetylesterase [Massilia sp. HP4]